VLVVDDEPAVLQLVTRMIREGGYEALPAKHGQEAWSLLAQADRQIDLVVADVVMPRMTGTELAARIADKRPGLPLILMSGFSSEDLFRRGLELSHGRLLTKPFEPEELLALVRQLLPV
jgi:two-component system cell cycle sensor histidine kinase/response regulator CckA